MNIYLDNAATTKMSITAIRAMTKYFEDVYANPSSLHTMGQKAKEELERARLTVANVLGASPNEIYFTSGGSESDNQAILSACYYGAKKGKRHVISTAVEHHAVLHTLEKMKKQGFEIELLKPAEDGMITAEQVANAIREDTCLVTVMAANNEIGTLYPIKEIGKICNEKKVTFHTDAVQAVGHIPVNVKELGCDMLSLSAHKFHGPKGVGVLYARKGVLLVNVIEGGAQERGKRAGTENLASIAAMAAALKEACDNLYENSAKIKKLRDKLINGLISVPHSVLNGPKDARLPGNVHICFEGIEGEALLLMLDAYGIEASSGSACTSGSLDPSHVLLSIGRVHEIAHGSLRLTLSEYTTEEEIDKAIEVIPVVVEKLRGFSPLWRDKVEGKKPFILK